VGVLVLTPAAAARPPAAVRCRRPSWSLAAVVGVITCGLLLLVAGETQFHAVGFVLVMTAAMLSGLRWTITQVLLQGHKHAGERAARPTARPPA
jgi:drug/metabolite transporter (DMT)-like permease